MATARIGTATKKIITSSPLMRAARMVAITSMNGARKSMRVHIMTMFCALFTSVVMRVTSEAVLKRSMLKNEKVCTLSKSALRSCFAKPAPPTDENRAAPAPKASEQTLMSTIRPPILST